MKKLLLLSLLLIPNLILSQSWVYNTSGNPIDGEFKYAYVEGKGGKFPYNDVKLFFNKVMKSRTYNLYISGAGYFIEDYSEVKVYFVFDDEEDIYISESVSISNDNELIFLENFEVVKTGNIFFQDYIIDKLKKSNSLFIRVEDINGKNDYKFNLSGSTKAINFVLN